MFRNLGRLLNWLGLAAFALPLLGSAIYAGVDRLKYSGLFGDVFVIDGETLDIGRQHYRLYGIAAPGVEQRCRDAAGQSFVGCDEAAVSALSALVKGQTVSCEVRETRRDKLIVAVCYAAGYDLGGELVRQGLAVAQTRHSRQYVSQEREAKAAGRGVWSGTVAAPQAQQVEQRR